MIYKQYDQEELNRQYNNRVQVPEYATYLEKWEVLSRDTEKQYPCVRDIWYGPLSRERLDIYPSSRPGAPTLVFIHGGYWRALDKSLFHFVADAFHQYAVTTVLITYPLAPQAVIDQVVLSCRKAIQWVHANIAQYNGDPQQIHIAGHSAGGHLAAMMMTGNTTVPPLPLKSVCAMSGLFNLAPIRLSDINETLQLDMAAVIRNSPVQLEPVIACPLLLTVGAEETDEYREQSEELYHAWKEKAAIRFVRLKGLNHFSIAEDLTTAGSLLHQEMRKQMGI